MYHSDDENVFCHGTGIDSPIAYQGNPLLDGASTQSRCARCNLILCDGICLDCGPVPSTSAKTLKVSSGSQLPYIRPQSVESLVRAGEVNVSVAGRSGIGAAILVDLHSMPFTEYYQRYFTPMSIPVGFYTRFQSAVCEQLPVELPTADADQAMGIYSYRHL